MNKIDFSSEEDDEYSVEEIEEKDHVDRWDEVEKEINPKLLELMGKSKPLSLNERRTRMFNDAIDYGETSIKVNFIDLINTNLKDLKVTHHLFYSRTIIEMFNSTVVSYSYLDPNNIITKLDNSGLNGIALALAYDLGNKDWEETFLNKVIHSGSIILSMKNVEINAINCISERKSLHNLSKRSNEIFLLYLLYPEDDECKSWDIVFCKMHKGVVEMSRQIYDLNRVSRSRTNLNF